MSDDGTRINTNVDIPAHWNTDDMDVVIDGKRFVSEAKSRLQVDALIEALEDMKLAKEKLYREAHVAQGNLEDEQVLRVAAEAAADELHAKLHNVQVALNGGDMSVPEKAPVLDAADAVWTPVTGAPIQLENEQGHKVEFTPLTSVEFTLGEKLPPEAVEHVKEVIVADEYNEAYFDEPVNGSRRKPRGWERWTRGLWIGIIAFVVGGSVGAATKADPPAVVETIENVQAGAAHASAKQNLTWAPSEGAGSYDVLIFRGGSLVTEQNVRATVFEVDLEAGSYQWVVYPLHGGTRSEAIVNSILEVS